VTESFFIYVTVESKVVAVELLGGSAREKEREKMRKEEEEGWRRPINNFVKDEPVLCHCTFGSVANMATTATI